MLKANDKKKKPPNPTQYFNIIRDLHERETKPLAAPRILRFGAHRALEVELAKKNVQKPNKKPPKLT